MNRYLKYGLIITVATNLVYFIIFFIDKALVFDSTYYWVNMAIIVAILIYAMREERTENGGVLDYGDRFKTSFLCLLFATGLSMVFQAILYNTDDEYRDLFYEHQMDMSVGTTKFVKKLSPEKLNKYEIEELRIESAKQINKDTYNPFSGNMLMATIFNIVIITLFYAFIIALFVGKEKLSIKERLKRIDL